MRIKIGHKWYTSEEQPIMVELTDGDKKNIANMHPYKYKYCEWDDDSDLTESDIRVFMEITEKIERKAND